MNFESYRTFLVQKTFVIYILGDENDWIVVTDVLQYTIGVRVFYHNYLNSITILYRWWSSASLFPLVIILWLHIFVCLDCLLTTDSISLI